MPLDDSDPYWAARFRMTPDQMDALRRKAEATVREGYHATTRAMAEAGEAAHRFGDQAGAAVDRFKVGVQAEIDSALGHPSAPTPRSLPVQAAPVAPTAPSKRDLARANGAGILLDRIAAGEVAGHPVEYDTTYGFGKYDPPGWNKPISQMTLDEVGQFQAQLHARSGHAPVGKYQILPATMSGLRTQMKLSGDALFDAGTQEQMGRELLRRRGWDAYLEGRISRDQLQDRLAAEWASVAMSNGRSRYPQPVGTTSEEVRAAIREAETEARRFRALGAADATSDRR